ncbi:MAG: nuclear transport factor 2 family protein [Gemmobacter sp.]|nr:nuclear transport factor 2 family protein [Gemmobacter sp.]
MRVALSSVFGLAPSQVSLKVHGDGDDPAAVVHTFLTAMEARDLPRAQALLAPGFEMTFPGDRRMKTLTELIEWAAPRYRFVRKTYERFDTSGNAVYCFGTLAGEWPDGTPFAGIRFIDRFEMSGGLIVRQQVWNDIAEVQRA